MKALAIIAGAGLLASTAVYAETADGEITGIDFDKMTITLDTGETIKASREGMLNELKTGNKVIVTYETKDGEKVASEILQPESGAQN